MFWQKIYRIFVRLKKNVRKIFKISSTTTLMEPPTPSAAPSSSTFATRPQPGNGTAHSTTAPGSGVSMGHLNFLPVKTQSTLKSPLEGHNLNPIHKPEEFLQKTLDSLSSTEWEANVTGLSSVVRLARHHPEYLLVEYKPLLQNVMKHVKNLRSQVITTILFCCLQYLHTGLKMEKLKLYVSFFKLQISSKDH